MSDNVVSIGNAPIHSARRQRFMEALAQAYDIYVTDWDEEPDALVFTLRGVFQPSEVSWMVEGESQRGMASILSLAAVHLAKEVGDLQQGDE